MSVVKGVATQHGWFEGGTGRAHFHLNGIDNTNGRTLGEGSYGIVTAVKYNGKEVACKTFRE